MRFVFVVASAVSALFSIACTPAAAPVAVGNKPISVNGVKTKDASTAPSRPLTEMSWTSFDGAVSKVKDHSGKAVILDFWATNCPPCIEEIPHLMELKARYGDDLELFGLHVGDSEDRERVPKFADKLKITYPLGYPDDALTSFVFETENAIPQTAVFDRNGVLVRKIVGFNPAIKADLDEAVKQAVETPVTN